MTHRDSCPAGPLGPLFGECNCPLKGCECSCHRVMPGMHASHVVACCGGMDFEYDQVLKDIERIEDMRTD